MQFSHFSKLLTDHIVCLDKTTDFPLTFFFNLASLILTIDFSIFKEGRVLHTYSVGLGLKCCYYRERLCQSLVLLQSDDGNKAFKLKWHFPFPLTGRPKDVENGLVFAELEV